MIFFIFITITLVGQAWGDLVIPSGIKLGAGTAAAQTEGAWNVDGKSRSVIDELFHGNVSTGNAVSNGDDAAKSYELWKTDVELIKNLGLQMYRFTIPWTRILPTGKPVYINQVAVDHYNNLIDALLAHNIEPVVTLLHFDLPQSLQDLGGWHNPEFPDWVADYARVLFSLYGDRVKTWLTLNEPIIECYVYDTKLFGNDSQPNLCAKNLLLAHAKAWRVYDNDFRKKQNGQASIVTNVVWMEAESDDDEQVAELVREQYVGMFCNPIYYKEGGWPTVLQKVLAGTSIALPELTREEIELMKGTYDFYAFNYYSAMAVRKAQSNETIGAWPFQGSPELGAILEIPSGSETVTVDGAEQLLYPEGIRDHMNWVKEHYNVTRFLVTENGLSSSNGTLDDQDKIVYIQDHLQQITLAIKEDDLDVFGYTMWALIDTFEFGFEDKFGLYRVNFTDPKRTRTPRDSFYYYKNLIANAKKGRPTKLVT